MARHPHRRARTRLGPGAGGSLIELLIASLLFLVALLAAAPLYMRAVSDVRTGATRSAAALLAQNRLEASSPPAVTIAATPVSALEYYSFEAREWLTTPPAPPDRTLWVRRTTLRRYPLRAVTDGRLERAESAPSGGHRPRIALVAVEVRVSRRIGGPPIAALERLEWTIG